MRYELLSGQWASLFQRGLYQIAALISYCFKQLHDAKTAEIKALVERKGGMSLHMGGIHRSGGRVVFVLQEGHNNYISIEHRTINAG